jgi:glycosyltransferase involved in cell wall biosynthesis
VTVQRTILSVAYPLTDVGADAVGGSEQILTILDRSLTEAGHRSIVIAAEGSKIAGKLIASPKSSKQLDDSIREWARQIHRRLIQETLAKYAVDLVHMHSLDFHNYVPVSDIPVLATLHLPPDWYPGRVFRLKRRGFRMNCVSWSQHRCCPRSSHLLEPIPNGVDVDLLEGKAAKRGFALAMGRICPEKGFHLAVDAAHRAGVELLLAGQVFPYESHLLYFKNQIQPRLDGLRRFVGPLGFSRKKRLLAQAKCLIIPSLVAETSSLVAMESLACGTPVIALRSGALPEIVEHGRTGFVVSDVRGIARALLKVERVDPDDCRTAAQVRFSAHSMADKYLGVYEQLIRKSPRN